MDILTDGKRHLIVLGTNFPEIFEGRVPMTEGDAVSMMEQDPYKRSNQPVYLVRIVKVTGKMTGGEIKDV